MMLDSGTQVCVRNPELCGSFAYIPVTLLKFFTKKDSLGMITKLFHVPMFLDSRFRLVFFGEGWQDKTVHICEGNGFLFTEDHEPLHYIADFANIPFPGKCGEFFDGPLGKGFRPQSVTFGESGCKMLQKDGTSPFRSLTGGMVRGITLSL